MRQTLHLFLLGLILVCTTAAWLTLAGIMSMRSEAQDRDLRGAVASLWGAPQTQDAPVLTFEWKVPVRKVEELRGKDGEVLRHQDGTARTRTYTVQERRQRTVRLDRTDLDVGLTLDQRRKGLMWYSLYDVDFAGDWSYTHNAEETGDLTIAMRFPDASGVYDGFSFTVDGEDVGDEVEPSGGGAAVVRPIAPGQTLDFSIGYRSRGKDEWSYRPTSGQAGQLKNFRLDMTTDFAAIDFPAYTMSPSERAESGDGHALVWEFERLVTGNGMGMVMPSRIQPGPLAAEMAVSAPISLALFMVWIYVLSLLKGVEIHPMNHLFLAAAFFAFHLLFGYSADHLPVEWAFALSSAVSVILVVSYLRLVAGPRFAFVEAGLAQLLYLVGFSLAHFWEGFTGLTVTVLGIATLFALMMLTGRIKWSEVFAGAPGPQSGASVATPAAVG